MFFREFALSALREREAESERSHVFEGPGLVSLELKTENWPRPG
jgi:hypothetical protein